VAFSASFLGSDKAKFFSTFSEEEVASEEEPDPAEESVLLSPRELFRV
jgi:hypothetical protein